MITIIRFSETNDMRVKCMQSLHTKPLNHIEYKISFSFREFNHMSYKLGKFNLGTNQV